MLTMSHDSPKDIALTRRQLEIVVREIRLTTSTRTLGEACKTIDQAQLACATERLNHIARQQVSVY